MPDPPTTQVIENPDGSKTYTLTKLRVLLLNQSVPNYQIAAAAGIHPSTLSEYVKGKKDIKAGHLVSLCEVLGVEPSEIIGWTEFTDG
jgi:DNA-binding Xre family transcriptional regulator